MDAIPTLKGQAIHINQPEHDDYNPPLPPVLGWLIGAVISAGLWVLIALTIGFSSHWLGWMMQ